MRLAFYLYAYILKFSFSLRCNLYLVKCPHLRLPPDELTRVDFCEVITEVSLVQSAMLQTAALAWLVNFAKCKCLSVTQEVIIWFSPILRRSYILGVDRVILWWIFWHIF